MPLHADTRIPPAATPMDAAATLAAEAPPLRPPDRRTLLSARRGVAGLSLAALVVLGLPVAAFTGLVLHHFYVKGAVFWDSGLLASLLWRSDPSLTTPSLFGGESFFATHVTPVFLLAALVSRVMPLSMAQFFAGFIGFAHALSALGVFWLLVEGYRLRTAKAVMVAVLVGIAFSFNGLSLAILRYPHFEMLIVGTFILFAVALSQRHLVAAGIFFVLCLATREDAGFHVFAVLAVLIALNCRYRIPWRAQTPELTFAALGLFYSLAALGLQLALFPNHSSLGRIYLGHPAFADVTIERLAVRLVGYLVYRTYIVLPAAIAVFWSLRARNPYLLVGYAAFLPWAILHLLAHSDIAGTLSGYYAYPFMIASFWPLVGVLIDRQRRAVEGSAAGPLAGFSLMIAASFAALSGQYNPARVDLRDAFLSPPSLARQVATDRAIAALVRSRPELGRVLVDGSILALAPNAYARDEVLGARQGARSDTVIYFVHGYQGDAARAAAAAAGLQGHYQIPGTSIRIATNRPLPRSPELAAILRPAATPE